MCDFKNCFFYFQPLIVSSSDIEIMLILDITIVNIEMSGFPNGWNGRKRHLRTDITFICDVHMQFAKSIIFINEENKIVEKHKLWLIYIKRVVSTTFPAYTKRNKHVIITSKRRFPLRRPVF